MFSSRNDPRLLRALYEGGDVTRDVGRILSVRSNVDDRIRGVVVYIRNRRINLLYSHRPSFATGQFTGASRVIGVTRGRDRHVPRKINRVVEAHACSGFEVG